MGRDGVRMCVNGRGYGVRRQRTLKAHTWFQGSTSGRTPEPHCQGTPAPVLLHIVSCPSKLGEQEERGWRS